VDRAGTPGPDAGRARGPAYRGRGARRRGPRGASRSPGAYRRGPHGPHRRGGITAHRWRSVSAARHYRRAGGSRHL